MREIWLKVDEFNKEIITTALESGIDAILITNQENGEEINRAIKKLGRVNTYLSNSKEIIFYTYKSEEDEDKIVEISKNKKLVLLSEAWEIIPWENLIAKKAQFYIFVKSEEHLKHSLSVLEKGVFGFIVEAKEPEEIRKFIKIVKSVKEKINLSEATVKDIKLLGAGERVCVDTCNLMNTGEGMLVGNSSECLFFVHSETIENPYCATRPFRVNAGAVHAYIKTNKDKTKYLCEIKSGDNVLIVNSNGEIREGIVGRSKIETRPLVFIQVEVENNEYSVILQNAETINLVSAQKKPVSVTNLKIGDKVLVELNKGARHFGIKIEENIVEK